MSDQLDAHTNDDGLPETRDSDIDPLLEVLISLADENDDFDLGITLHVSGLVITGKLVNRRRWIKEVAGAYPVIDGIAKAFAKSFDEDYANLSEPSIYFDFIHLVDARYFAGGSQGLPTDVAAHWRGRLSHVSGWTWGQLSSTSSVKTSGGDARIRAGRGTPR